MPPRSLRFGGLSSVYVGDRSERYLLAAPRSVKSPLSGPDDSVNRLFAFLFHMHPDTPSHPMRADNHRTSPTQQSDQILPPGPQQNRVKQQCHGSERIFDKARVQHEIPVADNDVERHAGECRRKHCPVRENQQRRDHLHNLDPSEQTRMDQRQREFLRQRRVTQWLEIEGGEVFHPGKEEPGAENDPGNGERPAGATPLRI